MLVRLADPANIAAHDGSEYYLRINFLFETTCEKYHWLNRLIAVASGRRVENGIDYVVWEVC